MKDLLSPSVLRDKYPLDNKARLLISDARIEVTRILKNLSKRVLVIVGPCSIHSYSDALEYADFISDMRLRYGAKLEILMRVYFEKPRTRVGWKGLIYDPWIDGSHDVTSGLELARRTMLGVVQRGVPVAHELLDVITPAYLHDLVSWGAIGARTVESQIHRQLASGCAYPIGFKNSTTGSVEVAIDGITASSNMHTFLSVNDSGSVCVVETPGNPNGHLILRGGRGPNYDRESVLAAISSLEDAELKACILVDLSHGNSERIYSKQEKVLSALIRSNLFEERLIAGVMIESNLIEGRQEEASVWRLKRGQSITDACVGLAATERMISNLAEGLH